MMRILLTLSLLSLALSSHAQQTVLSRDGVQSVLLSPDGEHIAILNRARAVDQFQVVNMATKSAAYSRKLASPQRIQSVAWIDNETLALQLGEDEKYQAEVQSKGEIEVLSIAGNSIVIGGTGTGEAGIQQALAGRSLSVANGLSSRAGEFLIIEQGDRALQLIDLTSDAIETLVALPFEPIKLVASPNSKHLAAEVMHDSGDVKSVVWSDTDDRGWRELDGNPQFVAINDSGIAHAIMIVDPGIASLVSVDIESGSVAVLFQDQSYPVDQVMLDSLGRPIAARYVADLPMWFYFDNTQRLVQLHKAFRAGTPQADFSFVSSSDNGATIIAKQTDDDNPSSFLVVDTIAGRADRLVASQRALSIVGGDENDGYTLQPVAFETATGSALSGYISVPLDNANRTRPTIVTIQNRQDESRWQWGFDEETWFFHKQGFNVLMLNGYSNSSAVEEAVHWVLDQDFAVEDQFCLFGRGTGAELALLTALRSDAVDCAISLGGMFENPDSLKDTAQADEPDSQGLHALLIYGADSDAEQLVAQEVVTEALESSAVAVQTLPIEAERHVFSLPQNEVRALARISAFLSSRMTRANEWSTLPLTYEQAIAMNVLHDGIAERMEKGVYKEEDWQRWFRSNDKEVRDVLFDEQLPLFESYQDEIIKMVEGKVGIEYRRFSPMRGIRNTQ